ncbi:MAG TPA: DUF2877 domain-containing protein [Micromonosporaceae bacterium]|nr:DUF2877 domain-containing protein [Micromonosporaceae bacterium]
MPPYPMAASAVVAPVLAGAPRPVRVVARTAQAAYLATGDPRLPALCLAGSDAVRLPCAVVVGPGTPVPAGAAGSVGLGRLAVGAFTARMGRWWRPPVLPRLARVSSDRLAACAASLATCLLDRPGGDNADRLAAALRTGEPPERVVRALLGCGPGLTPLGDDVLAGALVTLLARGAAAAGPLGAAATALAPARTTFVSAALLRHAARGECVPQLAAVLAAVGRDEPLDRPLTALLTVGHTSGSGLGHGVRVGLGAAL